MEYLAALFRHALARPELVRERLGQTPLSTAEQRRLADARAPDAVLQLLSVTKVDIAAFRDLLAATRSPVTVNTWLKSSEWHFGRRGETGSSMMIPLPKSPLLKASLDATSRRAFTVTELKTLLAAADGESKGAILFGIHTGQRLGDIARMRWENVDLEFDTLAFNSQKSRRRQILPIVAPLRKWLDDHRDPGIPSDGCVVPSLLAMIGNGGRGGTLIESIPRLDVPGRARPSLLWVLSCWAGEVFCF